MLSFFDPVLNKANLSVLSSFPSPIINFPKLVVETIDHLFRLNDVRVFPLGPYSLKYEPLRIYVVSLVTQVPSAIRE